MLGTVINPWFFYFAELTDSLKSVGIAGVIISAIVIIIASIFVWIWWANESGYSDEDDDKTLKIFIKILKKSTIICIISIFVATFVPSQETVYKMIIASYVTKENIEAGEEVVKDTVDYIIEKINEVQEGDNDASN